MNNINKVQIFRLLLSAIIVIATFGCTAKINSTQGDIVVYHDTIEIKSATGSYNFGDVQMNDSKTVEFTIANVGTGMLILAETDAITIEGTNSADFSIDATQTKSMIPSGTQTEFSVTFDPNSAGQKLAFVSIKSNDSDENPYTFVIHGNATPYAEISVKQGSDVLQNGTGEYGFADTLINETSAEITFTIENLGTEILRLTSLPDLVKILGADANSFKVNTAMTDDKIDIGDSTTFTVTFMPKRTGEISAIISIANNDKSNNPFNFMVKGKSVTPEINIRIGAEDILNSTGSYDFGFATVGKSSPDVEFTIENDGAGTLKLTDSPLIKISGTNATEFSVDYNNTDPEIASSAETTFKINFAPISSGAKAAMISISNNDLDENPYSFMLNGTGTNNELPFAEGWIGGGSDGWKTSSGASPADDFRSFKSQNGLFVDKSGYIYVADTYSHRICKWDSNGNALGWIGGGSNGWKTGSAPSSSRNYRSFDTPLSVFVDSAGYIYVADWGNNRVCKWSGSGNAVGWIGGGSNGWKTSNAPPQPHNDYQSFGHTGFVYVNSAGYIFVADPANHRVCKWDSSGNAIGWIGGGSDGWKTSSGASNNTDLRSMWNPISVFLDSSDNIYVSDFYNSRVSKWDKNGTAIGWIGGGSNGWKTTNAPLIPGSDYQSFNQLRGVFVDASGFIYVADAENHRICKWSNSGNALGWIGGGSNGWKTTNAPVLGNDYQSFNIPHGIFIDAKKKMFIGDTANNRICRWQE